MEMMHADTRDQAVAAANAVVENIERVIVGKHETVVRGVGALLANGHVLLEDVPGVGKTMLARAIARSIAGDYKRIQFTADLLPTDVTGVNMYRQDTGNFTFRRGPVFANVLLGDEINRATPRTQSSLLEAMEEMRVTVDGVPYELPEPFFVIATQNPIELEGTYPLPFAQMDRFMVRLRLGYLTIEDEARMVRERLTATPIENIQPVLHCTELIEMQQLVRALPVSDDILDYALAIVDRTRHTEGLEYGASPRGSLDLIRYSQALAFLDGRDYVLPDDVKRAAPPILAHRVIVRKGTRHGTLNTEALIDELLQTVPVPL